MSTPPTVPEFQEVIWSSSSSLYASRHQRPSADHHHPYDTYSECSTQTRKSDPRRQSSKIECEYCRKTLSSQRNRRLHLNICKLSPVRHSFSFECDLCPEWRGFSEQARTEHFKSKLHKARAEEAQMIEGIHSETRPSGPLFRAVTWALGHRRNLDENFRRLGHRLIEDDEKDDDFESYSTVDEPSVDESVPNLTSHDPNLDNHAAQLLLSLSRC